MTSARAAINQFSGRAKRVLAQVAHQRHFVQPGLGAAGLHFGQPFGLLFGGDFQAFEILEGRGQVELGNEPMDTNVYDSVSGPNHIVPPAGANFTFDPSTYYQYDSDTSTSVPVLVDACAGTGK